MKCAIFHCDNELSTRARLTVCSSCRNVFHYWEQPGKGVAAVIRRQGQLVKWQDRMSYMAENKPRFKRAKQHLPGDALERAKPIVIKPPKVRQLAAVERQGSRFLAEHGYDPTGRKR